MKYEGNLSNMVLLKDDEINETFKNKINRHIIKLIRNYLRKGLEFQEKLNSDFIIQMEDLQRKEQGMEASISSLIKKQEEMEAIIAQQNKAISEKNSFIEKLQKNFEEKEENFWKKTSRAQAGEDCIIAYILKVLGKDFSQCSYLDLGANHAKDLSNTYYFYEKGASGVLVEANPYLIPELKLYRNRDTILNRCISSKSGEKIKFYVFNGDGLSTPDYKAAQEFLEKNAALEIVDTVDVETVTVNEILEGCYTESPTILNIDIEGMEIDILKSIDFEKYRPKIIICEMIEYRASLTVGEKNKSILEYMKSIDYEEFAFTGINSIFIDVKNETEKTYRRK